MTGQFEMICNSAHSLHIIIYKAIIIHKAVVYVHVYFYDEVSKIFSKVGSHMFLKISEYKKQAKVIGAYPPGFGRRNSCTKYCISVLKNQYLALSISKKL